MYVHSFQTKIDCVLGANLGDLEVKIQQYIGSGDAQPVECYSHKDEKRGGDTDLNNSRYSTSDTANSR